MQQQLKIILIIGAVLVASWMLSRLTTKKNSDCTDEIVKALPSAALENFVAQNSMDIEKDLNSIVQMDTMQVNAVFNSIIKDDAGMFNVQSLPPFRYQASTREQTLQYIDDVLRRVNKKAGRNFVALDIQSTKRDSSFDPKDNGIIDRYIINLFVQEHDPRQVHASANDISMSFIVKPTTRQMMITELYFITDHFYEGPMVDGLNPADVKQLQLLNPFHLQQPFTTHTDKVLAADDQQIKLLKNYHKELRTPRYRCFGGNAAANSREKCESGSGYWDTPVTKNEECPFFQTNKNYVNRLGGVIPDKEFCELPVGMKRVGYRYYSHDPANKPQCYNCRIGLDGMPGGAGPCCDEQRNKTLYPHLTSPDYMFPGDQIERGQNWKELGDRGLTWQKHPTQIRNITNPRQKQPVFNSITGPAPRAN